MEKTMERFAQDVKDALQQELGIERTVEIKEVIKNNGVKLMGITAMMGENNLSPTVYLEGFYQKYINGQSIDSILREIRECLLSENRVNFELENFTVWENARRNICFRLINTAMNAKLLSDVPHFSYLDLSVVFYYKLDMEPNAGSASILITNSHLKNWGISKEVLRETADENTSKLNPPVIESMFAVMLRIMAADFNASESREKVDVDEIAKAMNHDDDRMYVLTNKEQYYGATCMLYPDVIKEFAERRGKDLYILPASVHEVILLEAEGECEDILRGMVKEVNATEVKQEERLSDNVYYYNRADDLISVCCRNAALIEEAV